MRRTRLTVHGALLLLIACCAGITGHAACLAAEESSDVRPVKRTPNVLLILADDLGYSDLGCYGGEIETPHLDRLAANGIRYSQFYNTARCWPTRAALMTGFYAQQVNRDAWPGATGGGQGQRPRWAPLLPDVLESRGYRSYHSGKWHLDGQPLQNGFHYSYRLEDHNRFFSPRDHFLDDVALPAVARDAGYYATSAIADHALAFLRDHHENHADSPFFAFVAFTSPHFPLQAPAATIEKYRERYARGWDELRDMRWRRLQERGWNRPGGVNGGPLSDVEYEVGPPYAFPEAIEQLGAAELNRPKPWNQLTREQQELQATKMAIHAAMVEVMDSEVGRLLDQVMHMGASDNTLVLFLSDNGASAEMMIRGDGHDRSLAPGSDGTFLCLGPGWSTVSNAPMRRHKTWVHEGGIATPLIVHWPQAIASPGRWSPQVGHVIDLFPTLWEACGGTPEDLAWDALPRTSSRGGTAPARPGMSLTATFAPKSFEGGAGETAATSRTLWWYHEGNRAVRVGNWKLVSSGRDGPWELYDLATDRCETRDLASENPSRVKELEEEWRRWLPADRQ